MGRLPLPASTVATAPCCGRRGRNGGGGCSLGDPTPLRDNRWTRLPLGGVWNPGRLPCRGRPLAVGGNVRHGRGRGNGRWHSPGGLGAWGVPRVDNSRV